AGSYWVKIIDGEGCFAYSDTLNITVDNFANEFTLGEDLELCSGNMLAAPSNPDIISWQWNNGAVTPQIPIKESGIYGITVTNTNGCIATDEVEVTIIGIAPETDFSADTVCLGNPTSFTDLSTLAEGNIDQWLWDFGDGNTSNEQNPQHTYSLPGSYMVSLTAIASTTCQKGITKEVIVKAVPVAYFETSTACINVPYQFNDLSTAPEGLEIVAWDWSFGDGNTSTIQNPMHTFSNSGTANIELNITTNNSCSSNFSETIEVVGEFPSPENFSMILPKSGSVISEGEVFIQHNSTQNAIEYLTQVSDNEDFSNIILETNSSANDTSYVNLPIGNYYVRSKAINICMNETYTPVINFIVFSPSSISNLVLWLEADSVQLIDNLVSVWFDKSGNSNNAIQNNLINMPSINNSSLGGRKSVIFNGSSNYLKLFFNQTLSQPISIILLHNYTQNTNRFIIDGVLQDNRFALWNSNNSFLQFTNEGSFGFVKNAPYDFSIITSVFNGNSSKIYNNNINQSSGNNGATQLSALTIGSKYTNLSFFAGEIPELFIFNKEISKQEQDYIHLYLQNKYSPPVNLGADKRIAYGFCPVVLDAGEQFASYLWNTGETTSSITVNTAGTYSVSVTDIFGFVSSDEVEVRFPDIGLNTMDTTLCQGESMELAFSSAFTSDISLLWNTGETSPSITVGQAGEYTLTLTDTLGCSTNLTAQIGIDDFENTATLGEDRPFCMGDTLWLQSPWQPWQLDYLWNDGSTGSGLVINQAGEYSLTATNPNGCSGTDTVSLSFQGYAPEVSFSAPPVCFGLPTSFTDGSTVAQSEIISRSWLFNDPQDPAGGASGSTVSHTYSEPGIFIASLEVSSIAGCSRSLSQAVQVYHLPEPAFGPPNVCANLNTPFSDRSTDLEGGIASWQWTATDTDGSTINTSLLQNPEFSFPNPGTASLKLITTSLVGCSDSISRNINVRYSPEVDFSFTPACLGDMVSFTNLSQAPAWAGIQSTHWNFGDGDTTLLTNPSHLFQEAGIYPVTLTARAINGCQISLSKDVTVNYPPIVAFETPPICAATDYQFIDNTTAPLSEITSWNWNFSGLGSSTEQNPWFSFELPGQYNISLEAKS
ncbi:MAG: PKD domain-containing protein, partial [Bacteroidales bacterium]|nr:PKD domain-containing protein [Bacteroidales bacterium]